MSSLPSCRVFGGALALSALLVIPSCGGDDDPPAGGSGGTAASAGKAGSAGRGSGGRGGASGRDGGGEAGEMASGGSGIGGSSAGRGSTTGGSDGDGGTAGRAPTAGRGGSAGAASGGAGTTGDAGEGGGDQGGDGGTSGTGGASGGGTGGSAGTSGTGGGGVGGSCVKVSPDGDDVAAAASSGATAFASVQAAIDFAFANPSVGTEVCVAAGPTCGMSASYAGPAAAALRMRDGISVYGRYESTGFTRCASSTTTLAPTTTAGVLFGPEISSETALDGFTVTLVQGATTHGVQVDGATGVVLNDLLITDEPSADADAPYGVLVANGGDAIITDTEIRLMLARNVQNGLGVAIQSIGSRVRVSDCRLFGHVQFGQAAGVFLADSPTSEVLDTSITITKGNEGDYSGFGAWVDGDLDQVLLDGLAIDVDAGDSSTGVAFLGSGDAILRDSTVVVASGGEANDGVYADADDVLVEGNDVIVDFSSTNLVDSGTCVAVHCPATCTIRDNVVRVEHTAVTIGDAGTSVGIACTACDEISENDVNLLNGTFPYAIGGIRTSYYDAVGIDVGASDVLIDRNVVSLGCADSAIGMRATGARIQNNSLAGRQCAAPNDLPELSNGLVAGAGSDVHSNSIFSGSCTGDDAAVYLVAAGARLRNNILGGCGFNVQESTAERDPLLLENNDFVAPAYRNGSTTLSTIEAINALPGAAANFSASCSGTPPTPCSDTGTPTGAPAYDIDGDPRSNPPDVGADER